MNIIQNKLNEIFETKITFYKFDLLNNKITMNLEKIENGIRSNHKLELEKISTAYFINNTSNKRKNIFEPEEDDNLELTSLNILEKSVLFRIESVRFMSIFTGENPLKNSSISFIFNAILFNSSPSTINNYLI